MRWIPPSLILLFFWVSIPCTIFAVEDYDDYDYSDEEESNETEPRELTHSTSSSFKYSGHSSHNGYQHHHHHHHSHQHIPMEQPLRPVYGAPVEIEDVRRVVSCPPGYDLQNDQCVTNDVVQPDHICPPGFQSMEGRCLSFIKPQRDCPESYQLINERCSFVEVVSVQYTCPDGTLDETGKGCVIASASLPQCPAGFFLENDVCIQRSSPIISCPDGYMGQHHGCVKQHSFDATPICPSGTELDPVTNGCFRFKYKHPVCPKGFKMNKETAKCVKKVKRVLAQCPEGFTTQHHESFCTKEVHVPPELTCPVGAYLDGRTGQCSSDYPENFSCPDGYQESRTHQGFCDQIVEEFGTCPPGSKAVGHGSSLRCQTTIEKEMTECCPNGFEQTYDGRCSRTEFFKPIPSCTDCITVKSIPAEFLCRPDFVNRGSLCVKIYNEPCEKTVDCTVYERILSSNGSLRSLNALDIPSECRPETRNLCKREEVLPAQIQCPPNTSYNGESCVERSELLAEPRCVIGVLDLNTQRCVKTTTVPVKTECSPGSIRIGNRCVNYIDNPPEYSCPEESIIDSLTGSCVIRIPAMRETLEAHKTAPLPVCPFGTLQSNFCSDIERLPRSYICPNGAVPVSEKKHGMEEKYCLLYSEFIVPPPEKKHVKPIYSCADGRIASHMKCHSVDHISPVSACPPGSETSNETCIRRLSPISARPRLTSAVAIPVCPAGTTVQGTKCIATRHLEASSFCSPGYYKYQTPNGKEQCAKSADLISVCPIGTLETADGCLARKTAPTISDFVPVSCEEPECYRR